MQERADWTKNLRAMIFLLNIVSTVLLFAALIISAVSLTTLCGSFIFGKREPSTCFVFVWILCMISCVLHSKSMSTWFRIVGIVTVSMSMLELSIRWINLMCKWIKLRFGHRTADISGFSDGQQPPESSRLSSHGDGETAPNSVD